MGGIQNPLYDLRVGNQQAAAFQRPHDAAAEGADQAIQFLLFAILMALRKHGLPKFFDGGAPATFRFRREQATHCIEFAKT